MKSSEIMLKKIVDKLKIKFKKNKAVLSITVILVLISFILYIIVILISYVYKNEDPIIKNILCPAFETLSSVLLSTAIGGIILSFFDFIEYAQKRIAEVMITNDFIKLLKKDALDDLKNKIDKVLFNISNDEYLKFSNQFYLYLNDCNNEYYYKEHSNRVTCQKIEFSNNKYKKILNQRTLVFGLKNNNKKINIKNILYYNYMDISELKQINIFKVKSVVIYYDGKRQNLKFNIKTDINKDTEFNQSIYNNTGICYIKDGIEIKENLKLVITYEVIEPLSDITYVTRMDKFCEDFNIDFVYDENDFCVAIQTFGFGLVPYSNKKNINICTNRIRVDFESNLYPGDGTIFTIINKE